MNTVESYLYYGDECRTNIYLFIYIYCIINRIRCSEGPLYLFIEYLVLHSYQTTIRFSIIQLSGF